MAQLRLYILLLLTILNLGSSQKTLSLDGDWLLKDDKENYLDLPAKVPGGIYTDLMNNNIIDDIFYGYNDNVTRWVPRTNWTYYTDFTVDDELLNHENINIVFEGLDTISSIFINDALVGETQNMFVQYIFDIKSIIKEGKNTIEVQFQSPIEAGTKLAEKLPYKIPVECPPAEYRGECHVNMLRKMQASYSWDWGPSFPSVGIWKNVFVEAFDESVLRYVVTDVADLDNETWILSIDTYLATNSKKEVSGLLTYTLPLEENENVTIITFVAGAMPNEYSEIVPFTPSIEIPKALTKSWWPNGYGEQKLYELQVQFTSNDGETSTITQKIGFRTIELVQDKIDSGLTFYFKVNGVPMFMKGSNEIPIDILPEKGQNKAVIKKILTAARDVHMNMLRVWGGGVYESDYFYDLADEFGILIWQDFMFACSLYPATKEYTDNVLEEVRHQVKRLTRHPSIALLAGNNENEGDLASNWFKVDNFTLYKEDYIKLYVDTIQSEVNRLTHNRSIYASSSPSNGLKTIEEGYVASEPGSQFYGDIHHYDYNSNGFDTNNHPIPRFISEFGLQAMPSLDSLMSVTDNVSDLNINSDFMNSRQHHPNGNEQMKTLITNQLNLPSEDSPNYLKAFAFYTQIIQAWSIRVGTEHYRTYRSILNEDGRGYTMGALYWQLNDVWVAPTWAGIDYTLRWKMLQYSAKEFLAPVIITGAIDKDRHATIYVVSDLLANLDNVTALIDVFNWNSLKPVTSTSLNIDVKAGQSDVITEIDTENYLSSLVDCGESPDVSKNCIFYLRLQQNGVNVSPENVLFPATLKDSNVQQPILKVESVVEVEDGLKFDITLKTDRISAFVWLDSHDVRGVFSENGFVQVTESKIVSFTSENPTTVKDLSEVLTVINLLDKDLM